MSPEFTPKNWTGWSIVGELKSKISFKPEANKVAVMIPKNIRDGGLHSTVFDMKLAIIDKNKNPSAKAVDVMSLSFLEPFGFIANGTGFTTIYLESDSAAINYPQHSKKIDKLVESVMKYRKILVMDPPKQEVLESIAMDVAPALAKFFDLTPEG